MRTRTVFIASIKRNVDVEREINGMEDDGWAVRQIARTTSTEYGSSNMYVVYERED